VTLRTSQLLSAQLLGGREGGAVSPSLAPTSGIALGFPGEPSPVPTLLIAISDDSASVASAGGNDPLAGRYREMREAFAAVARAGVGRELGAVVHFDVGHGVDVDPVRLTRRGLARLAKGLRVPSGGGTSELSPSLTRATQLAHAHSGFEVTLVVFSDFQLFDADPAQVLTNLTTFPGAVHVVMLGSDPAPGLFDDAVVVSRIMPGDPPGTLAQALFRSLVAHRPGSSADGAVSP
jgi:hypothetical protein